MPARHREMISSRKTGQADAPNPAIAPWFDADNHWRRVGDPERWGSTYERQ